MWGVYTAAVRYSRASIAELSRGRVPRAEARFKDRAARVLSRARPPLGLGGAATATYHAAWELHF